MGGSLRRRIGGRKLETAKWLSLFRKLINPLQRSPGYTNDHSSALCTQLQPTTIFIDAPLSLPLAYFGKGDNYFYRDCDKLLKGMSPMFLGGLTARAMKLANSYEKTGISFLETYPAQIVKHYLAEITEGYKKQKEFLANFCEILTQQLPYGFAKIPNNWHQVDSALAWWAGWRYKSGEVKIYGNEVEGVIYI